MTEVSALRWQQLNPLAVAGGGAEARRAFRAMESAWDSLRPTLEAGIEVSRAVAQLMAQVSLPQVPGLQQVLDQALASLQGYLSSGLLVTVHHNIRRNHRFVPGVYTAAGQVVDQEVFSTPGTADQVVFTLPDRPRRGTLVLRLPNNTRVQDDDGVLVGTGVEADSRVDHRTGVVRLHTTAALPAGTTTASYVLQRTPESLGAFPWCGDGVEGFLGDLRRTLPQGALRQSASGIIVLCGSRTPGDFAESLGVLGKLFGRDGLVEIAEGLKQAGERLGVAQAEAWGPIARAGADRVRDHAPLGPPHWYRASLVDLIPSLGDVYRSSAVLLDGLRSPPEMSEATLVALRGVETKLAAVETMLDRIGGAFDTLAALAGASGSGVYVLPLVETDEDGTAAALGAMPTGLVSGGSSGTAEFFDAIDAAVWPVDPLDASLGTTTTPPPDLRGDALVAGVCLLAVTGNPEEISVPLGGQPSPLQMLTAIFGVEASSGTTFGGGVQRLADRAPTRTPTTAP